MQLGMSARITWLPVRACHLCIPMHMRMLFVYTRREQAPVGKRDRGARQEESQGRLEARGEVESQASSVRAHGSGSGR